MEREEGKTRLICTTICGIGRYQNLIHFHKCNVQYTSRIYSEWFIKLICYFLKFEISSDESILAKKYVLFPKSFDKYSYLL